MVKFNFKIKHIEKTSINDAIGRAAIGISNKELTKLIISVDYFLKDNIDKKGREFVANLLTQNLMEEDDTVYLDFIFFILSVDDEVISQLVMNDADLDIIKERALELLNIIEDRNVKENKY